MRWILNPDHVTPIATTTPDCHLLVVELHVEVAVVGQRDPPHQASEGEGDGAVVQKEVKQIVLAVEGTHHLI